jgi:hypothetical protein
LQSQLQLQLQLQLLLPVASCQLCQFCGALYCSSNAPILCHFCGVSQLSTSLGFDKKKTSIFYQVFFIVGLLLWIELVHGYIGILEIFSLRKIGWVFPWVWGFPKKNICVLFCLSICYLYISVYGYWMLKEDKNSMVNLMLTKLRKI